MRTRAANVTKDIFPSLIKELWEKSIKPEHLRGGFKSAGLAPFNPTAIPSDRLSPSLVVRNETSPELSPESQPTAPELQGAIFNGTGLLNIGGETPIRVELRAYFVKALQPADKPQGMRRRRRVELSDYGEVLTNDQVLERLEQADVEKKRKEAEKARKAAEKKS